MATEIWRPIPQPFRWLVINARGMLTPDEGARTTLHCATAPELAAASGRYYDREREATPSPAAQDDALAARLWQHSEQFARIGSSS